jgi:dihydroxy-acid dehydratase
MVELEIHDATLKHRLAEWKPPKPRYATGVFAKYGALVHSASEGAITKPR